VEPPTGGNYSDNFEGGGTTLTFNNGAIQINVEKGENIDENKLAAKIKKVILDMQRSGNTRGGTI
jgi:hypothetical protein